LSTRVRVLVHVYARVFAIAVALILNMMHMHISKLTNRLIMNVNISLIYIGCAPYIYIFVRIYICIYRDFAAAADARGVRANAIHLYLNCCCIYNEFELRYDHQIFNCSIAYIVYNIIRICMCRDRVRVRCCRLPARYNFLTIELVMIASASAIDWQPTENISSCSRFISSNKFRMYTYITLFCDGGWPWESM
jgi:hypothetical protein